MRLKDKVAIVTGSGSGFGEGIAQRFTEEGAKVVVAEINVEHGIKVAGKLQSGLFVEIDVRSNASVKTCVEKTLETHGCIDIVVNNAGVSHLNRPMLEVDEATFDDIYAVNVKGIYNMVVHVTEHLIASKGNMVNIGSTGAVSPRAGLTWYNGTKGAVTTLTQSMAMELAPHKVRVNAVNPVFGDTGLTETFMGGSNEPETYAKFVGTIPLGRASTPMDIANATLFLASDEAELITGLCMEVDGGRCI
jgi:3-oxoacyl-[acyl-carrier protein] reductase